MANITEPIFSNITDMISTPDLTRGTVTIINKNPDDPSNVKYVVNKDANYGKHSVSSTPYTEKDMCKK